MLVSTYLDHTPPYCQARIYARAGLDIDRETMVGWVGKAAWLLQPLTERTARHVFTTGKSHTDDTPLLVLAPDSGRTRRGRV